MPPSWFSSGSGSRNNSSSQRDRAAPRSATAQQTAFFDPPPTLHPDRAAPSPSRPHTSGGGRHTHSRSVSHPLPKIFGRKKSARDLFNDTDVPLDDDLVPVLVELQAPTRVVSGKKGKEDEGNKIARRCICCDSKVNVPQNLERFRCLACLTINELRLASAGKNEGDGDRSQQERPSTTKAGSFPGVLPPNARVTPLSVERTRLIIDRCLVAYLEARCKRQDGLAPPLTPRGVHSQLPLPSPRRDVSAHTLPIRPKDDGLLGRQLTDAPVSTSPPDTPEEAGTTKSAPTANIKSFDNIDHFSYARTDTPPDDARSAQNGHALQSPKRKPVPIPARPTRKPPPPPMTLPGRQPPSHLHPNGNHTPNGLLSPIPGTSPRLTSAEVEQRKRYERVKTIFRPLEEYLVSSFGDQQCLNSSFSTLHPTHTGRARSESHIRTPPPEPVVESMPNPIDGFSELDAKTLLLGELGENSSWWTGKLDRLRADKSVKRKRVGEGPKKAISSKSPNVDWAELNRWYYLIHSAGGNWQMKVQDLSFEDSEVSKANVEGFANAADIEEDLEEARKHAIRALLKMTENVLKRPAKAPKEPEDLRFLFIILANPSLYPTSNRPRRAASDPSQSVRPGSKRQDGLMLQQLSPRKSPGREAGQHTGLLKRIFGLLAHSSDNCHRYMINWFARFDEEHFIRTVDLVASFVNYRITRRTSGRPHSKSAVDDGGLIPDLSGSAMSTSAQLHSAMGLSGSMKKRNIDCDQETDWATDWQTKAAAKLMSLLFAANNIWQGKARDGSVTRVDSGVVPRVGGTNTSPQTKTKRSGQLLHTSYFYNTLLDYHDMIADFKIWELKRDKFAFCQYPLFLSMGSKIKVLEYDARRQMESKAREAYFDQVIRQRAIDGYFHLRVRRDCLVDDSLRQISEAVGAGQEELKKGLRVHFTGEEGVDAGGPRKEWFLILVRDIFDPNYGLFVYDDDSNTCYFNPNSFETSDQYYLVGALLGLAIYNSTILDIALPPFAFRKLLAAAPSSANATSSNISSLTGTKGQMTYTIADLAEFRPSLAAGLQRLLDFEGDVESTYCRDFVAPVERYGTLTNVPLIPNGEATPVTNANRHDFIDAYIRYLLDTSVTRQFEPFKRGFFTVCAGNALSLFRAEEIELLVRGSDEALDVDSLRAVAVYENWRHHDPPHLVVPRPADSIPVIGWFWECFALASPERQRKLLTFITGSDRIPAVGATSLVLRVIAGGDGWGGGGEEERARFPVARTCFNMLVLWRYESREMLEGKLWRAVEESEGFGLK